MAKDFVFTYEGVDHWLDDLTIAEATEVEVEIGEWSQWRPIGLVKHRLVLMTVFLRRTHSEDDVAKILEGLTLKASRDMWDLREEDLPDMYEDGIPKAVAALSTPTS